MKLKKEGFLSSLLKVFSGLDDDEFQDAQKDVQAWNKIKKQQDKDKKNNKKLSLKNALKKK
tara:strand:+ start:409 stop:591 length:183 start_codon:yes stop_codon:yes gene_type:complete